MLTCLVAIGLAAGVEHMAYKAHVWLTSRTGEGRIDLGIIDVDPKPALHGHVSFKYAGKLKGGVVDQIYPYEWEKRPGTTPRIHVTLSADE
jgi:hypothetical protein